MKMTGKLIAICVLVMVLLGINTWAASTIWVGGIKVTVSPFGSAYYDAGDDTLTVAPGTDWCTIKVVATPAASIFWGGYCDVYINATGYNVNKIQLTATPSTTFWVTGQTWYTSKFQSLLAICGNTDTYGLTVGLGANTATSGMGFWPTSVSMKRGTAWAPLLYGVQH